MARHVSEATTTELDDFLSTVLPRQIEADKALHDGDPNPRMETWSTRDPVTVLGAIMPCVSGWDQVNRAFRWIATQFSNSETFDFDLVAAGVSGDLAYTVGFERSMFSFRGGPVAPGLLRVTHVYRRENGEWKIVHRHADVPPIDQRPQKEA